MQSKLSLLISLLTASTFAVAQKVDSTQLKNSHKPKLMLDIMLIDAPYIKYSGQARANYKAVSGSTAWRPLGSCPNRPHESLAAQRRAASLSGAGKAGHSTR